MLSWLLGEAIEWLFEHVISVPIKLLIKVGQQFRVGVELAKIPLPQAHQKARLLIGGYGGGLLLLGAALWFLVGGWGLIVFACVFALAVVGYFKVEVGEEVKRLQAMPSPAAARGAGAPRFGGSRAFRRGVVAVGCFLTAGFGLYNISLYLPSRVTPENTNLALPLAPASANNPTPKPQRARSNTKAQAKPKEKRAQPETTPPSNPVPVETRQRDGVIERGHQSGAGTHSRPSASPAATGTPVRYGVSRSQEGPPASTQPAQPADVGMPKPTKRP